LSRFIKQPISAARVDQRDADFNGRVVGNDGTGWERGLYEYTDLVLKIHKRHQ
jgi:hypothetical protein